MLFKHWLMQWVVFGGTSLCILTNDVWVNCHIYVSPVKGDLNITYSRSPLESFYFFSQKCQLRSFTPLFVSWSRQMIPLTRSNPTTWTKVTVLYSSGFRLWYCISYIYTKIIWGMILLWKGHLAYRIKANFTTSSVSYNHCEKNHLFKQQDY